MQLVVLLVLSLACYPVVWPAPVIGANDPTTVVLTAGGFVGLLWGISWLFNRATVVALRRPLMARSRIIRWYHRGRLAYLLTCLAVYLGLLYLGGWGWAVQALLAGGVPSALPTGGEVILLAPYLLAWMGAWVTNYPAERCLHATSSLPTDQPFGSLWTHLGSMLRQNILLVFVPLSLLIVRQNIVRIYPALENELWFRIGQMGVFILLAILMPLLLRYTLKLRPLEPGPLRDQLQATARRLRFWSTDILVWDTRGQVANALIAGLLPWPRYVVFTDRLIAELSPDEVETVYGHEIGHVRHWHMPLYLFTLTLSLFSFMVVWVALEEWLFMWYPSWQVWVKTNESIYLAVPQVVIAVYIFLLFGALSRRCERQADLVGCRTSTDTITPTNVYSFMQALNRVCAINGLDPVRPGVLQSWLHGTPAQRIGFLERVANDGRVADQFERRLWWFKWGLVVVLAGVLVAVGVNVGWERVWARL